MKVKPSATPGQVVVQLSSRDDPLLEESVRNALPVPFRLKKILVPVDFSACSHQALDYARSVSQAFGAELLLLHVVEPMIVPENLMLIAPELPALGDNLLTVARGRTEELREQVAARGLRVQSLVRVGRACDEIIEAAKIEGVDLIIIATHGYTGLKHALLGSTAERVVRHCPCPVLTVRQPAG